MWVPILSRLRWEDYKRLLLAVLILMAESMLRLVAWLVPVSLLDYLRFRMLW